METNQSTMDYVQEEQPKASPLNAALKFGIIGGLVMILASLLFYLFEMRENMWINALATIAIIFVSVYLAQVNHRDQDLGGYMKYGRGLGTGMLTVLFIALLTNLFSVILRTVIDPGLIDAQLETQRQAMIEQGMSDEEMENAMKFTKMFIGNPIILFFTGLLGTAVWGLIISLISAAFTRK